jgi:6-phosphofructokinase
MSKGLAILTSGGDSAGMNPAVKCAVDYANQRGYETHLIYDGLRGLIADNIVPATRELVSGMLHHGGTRLRSSRSPEFYDIEVRRVAYENLKRRGIGNLIVIGGDGSFRALNQFYADFGVPFACIPATIDNDIAGMEARLTLLGHIQRGGSPTVLDRVMAFKFAVAAVDALEAGQTNSIMVYRDGTYGHLPIQAGRMRSINSIPPC